MLRYKLGYFAFWVLLSCSGQATDKSNLVAFTDFTLIDGNGGEPIENAVLILENGLILEAGSSQNIDIPKNATVTSISGKIIIPGLINAHAHVGYQDQVNESHYSSDNIKNQLELYAKFGITTVASLGEDRIQATYFQSHVDSVNAQNRSRLFIAGDIIFGNSVEDVKEKVDGNAKNGSDYTKIRVDNNRGRSEAMAPEIYQAIIQKSHQNGIPVMAHMYDLSIAKGLLNADADFLAHSVRDKEVDEALISLMKRKDACYCATLTRDLSTFIYGDTAAFFSDPYFMENANVSEVAALLDPERQNRVRSGNGYELNQQALKMAMINLKILADANVNIAMGTDSGMPNRFQGYFEHLEMEMMEVAGMSPMQIIQSATSKAAECLGLENLGTLEKGKFADFLILDANPLEGIINLREISSVWIGGEEVK